LTVTGSNEDPVIEANLSENVTEDAALVVIDLLEGASDPDPDTTLSVTGLPSELPEGATLDGSTLNFDPSNVAYQALAVGETQEVTLSYTIIDGAGGSVEQSLTITVTGANDAPAVEAALISNTIEDGEIISVDLLEGASDVDNGAALSVTDLPEGLPAGVTVDGTILSFDPSDAAYQSLAEGETQDVVIAYSIEDGEGGSVPQTVTLTVTGTNDLPTVETALNANATEDGDAISVDLLEGISDVDNGAVLSVVGLPEALPEGVSVNGSTLSFDPSDAAYQSLAAGETQEIVLSYFIADGGGTNVPQTLTLTVTGANDAPTVEAVLTAVATEDGDAVSVDLLEGASDVDNGAVLSVAGLPDVLPEGVSIDGSILSFDPGDVAYQSLAAGEIQDVVISYSIEDGEGGTVSQTLTLTVTGTNDLPTVEAALSASATEDEADIPQTLTLTVTGTNDLPTVEAALSASATEDEEAVSVDLLEGASDVDNGAVLSVVGLPEVLPEGVSVDGSTLSFDPSDDAYQSLADGETQDIVLSYFIADGGGTDVEQTLTLTVTGTNDAPTVEAALIFPATEDGETVSVDLLEGASDVDNGATLFVTGLPEGLPAGTSIDGTTLNFDPSDEAYQSLAAGETQDIIISYTIEDGEGGSVPQSATITVTGTNDTPTVAAALIGSDSEDGEGFGLDLLDGASDVDNGAILSVENVTGLVAGVTLIGTNLSVNPSDAAFQSLADGDSQEIIINYDITDGAGGSVPQTATITIFGTNDLPTVEAELAADATEDGELVNVDLLEGADDIDDNTTLSVTGLPEVLPEGVTIDGATLTIDPSDAAYQSLAVGETQDIEISYVIDDGDGGSVSQTLTLTVTGTNDVPTIQAALSAAYIEGGSVGRPIFLLNGASDIDASDTLSIVNLSALPDGVSYNNDIKAITVDPQDASFESLAEGDTDTIIISYDITDNNGGVVPQTLTITINGTNDVPVVASALNASLSEDANDPVIIDLLQGASDVDENAVLSVLFSADEPLPEGISLDGNTLVVDPLANAEFQALADGQTQDITISYDVVDELGASTAQTLTLTIVGQNDAPSRLGFIPNVTFGLDEPFSFDADEGIFFDVDNGDSLTFTATLTNGDPLPDFISFDPATVTFSGTATGTEAGIYRVLVTATDTSGATRTDAFNLSLGGNFIVGTENSETLSGTNLDEIISGLEGDDIIDGFGGSDLYVFNEGDGSDIISDTGFNATQIDSVQFTGYDLADATFSRGAGQADYIVSFPNGDSVTLINTLNGGSTGVETLIFADQTVDREFVRLLLIDQAQTDDDDGVLGFFTNDILEGGLGDDTMSGSRGADRYIFNEGDGNDTINDGGLLTNVIDTLAFTDYAFDDATFSRIASTETFVVSFANGDSVTATLSLNGGARGIDVVEFTDRSVSIDEIRLILIDNAQTDGNDTVNGFFTADVLEGGLGDDLMSGSRGADTYIFNAGDGNDVVDDDGLFSNVTDTLRFTDYNLADATFTKDGEDIIISFSNGDTVTVDRTINGGSQGIDIYEFADQTVDAAFVRDAAIANQTTDGDDIITGSNFGDTLEGGLGNDELFGGRGGDTYVFNSGDGQDLVDDNGIFNTSTDTLRFTDYNLEDAIFSSVGADLIISFANGDRVEIDNTLNGGNSGIDVFEFADQTIDIVTMRSVYIEAQQTDGDDTINGTNFADRFEAGLGNDSLSGGRGVDRYVFNVGDGMDSIEDNGNSGQDDILEFTGYSSTDAAIVSDGGDLIIAFANGDQVRVENGLSSRFDRVEQFQFQDTTLTYEDIVAIIESYNGSEADDVIEGTFFDDMLSGDLGNDIISGFAGNDDIDGGDGSDVITGGVGNDMIDGGRGADTFIFASGDGSDTINNTGVSGETDILEFSDYNVADASFQQDGNDLRVTFANGDSVLIDDALRFRNDTVDSFVFANGTLSLDDVADQLVAAQQTTGDDLITGFNRDDVLEGGQGNDVIEGLQGDDIYLYTSGDDNDLIIDSGGNDSVSFTDYASTDATVTIQGNDLIISFSPTDSVTVNGGAGLGGPIIIDGEFDEGPNTVIEDFTFTDGTFTLEQVLDMVAPPEDLVLVGDDGDNRLDGDVGNDSLTGGLGNDVLNGREGDDSYFYTSGDDNDLIIDSDGDDSVIFTDYASTDATVNILGSDLVISFSPTESVTISGGAGLGGPIPVEDGPIFGPASIIENFTFTDGTFTLGQILDLVEEPEDLVLVGDDGDNTLEGGAGNDSLTGGLGNDTLIGGAGDDSFFFNIGDGQDTIIGSLEGRSNDVLVISGYSDQEFIAMEDFENGTVTLMFFDSNDSITFDFSPFGGPSALDAIVFTNDIADPEDDVVIDVFEFFGIEVAV